MSTAIRTEEVGMAASAVGANPAVRAFLLGMQRDMAKKQDVLMDGRDIGTVVLPDATVKIFLTASPEARATCGPVAQLDRVFDYESKGRGFESRRAHHRGIAVRLCLFAYCNGASEAACRKLLFSVLFSLPAPTLLL